GQVNVGKDLTVTVQFPRHPRAVSAQMELVYDPAVITTGDGSGRAAVRLDQAGAESASSSVTFRVVAKTPGTTELRLNNADVRDPPGNSGPVPVPAPPTVNIVPCPRDSCPARREALRWSS